jgi:hypothetical protein
MGDDIHLSCTLEVSGGAGHEFWFLVPRKWEGAISSTADAYVLISLFTTMRYGGHIRIEGEVSSLLLSNLPEVATAWRLWAPRRYKPVTFDAAAVCAHTPAHKQNVLMTFSGGLDSCHSLWRFLQSQNPNKQPHVVAMMAHGFDIALDDETGFAAAYARSCRILDSVNVEALRIKCNVRQHPGNWEHVHGAALAACLQLLNHTFYEGRIASTHSYDTLRFPWGSNPLTDPLLSTESMSIVYDTLTHNRNDKARDISTWSAAMENIRSCWKNSNRADNCGKCVLCITTALAFAAEGIEPPAALNVGQLLPAVKHLAKLKWTAANTKRIEDSIVTPALRNGINSDWLDKLIQALRRKKQKAALVQLIASLFSNIRPTKRTHRA